MKTRKYQVSVSGEALFEELKIKNHEKIHIDHAQVNRHNSIILIVHSEDFPEYEIREGEEYRNALIEVDSIRVIKSGKIVCLEGRDEEQPLQI